MPSPSRLMPNPPNLQLFLALGIIWFIAGLNIAGIKANARFTFGIFILAAFVILNLVVSGLVDFGRLGLLAAPAYRPLPAPSVRLDQRLVADQLR